jgi:DNA-binding Lrp family transcriptional regulator
MQIQRVTSLLQGVANVRKWVVENVPLTSSMVGYDLFLKLGNDFIGGRPLDVNTLLRELPHPEKSITQQIKKMEDAGLIVAQPAAVGARKLLPTRQFVHLLETYSRKFESTFILRKGLRDQQLMVMTEDDKLREFAESLYDNFYDLGWLYLHNFGGVCFLMASLVKRVAAAYGYTARVESCYVDVSNAHERYMLGAQGFAKEGQIDGHAMCVIDDALIIDFGLGNIRKGYRRDFYWAMACDYRPEGSVLASVGLPTGHTVTWKNDWQSPDSEAELARYAPHIDELFQQYETYFS